MRMLPHREVAARPDHLEWLKKTADDKWSVEEMLEEMFTHISQPDVTSRIILEAAESLD
jgi:hypothetical protein